MLHADQVSERSQTCRIAWSSFVETFLSPAEWTIPSLSTQWVWCPHIFWFIQRKNFFPQRQQSMFHNKNWSKQSNTWHFCDGVQHWRHTRCDLFKNWWSNQWRHHIWGKGLFISHPQSNWWFLSSSQNSIPWGQQPKKNQNQLHFQVVGEKRNCSLWWSSRSTETFCCQWPKKTISDQTTSNKCFKTRCIVWICQKQKTQVTLWNVERQTKEETKCRNWKKEKEKEKVSERKLTGCLIGVKMNSKWQKKSQEGLLLWLAQLAKRKVKTGKHIHCA